ncbi:hypothetical protein BJ741DRAFT_609609 [Chytriomyces cf. hyalinus JEL632]|nr:hypothetical protein BJ741DRAFT_609609 [Chytriomyces cf. hyalinus JEL632]
MLFESIAALATVAVAVQAAPASGTWSTLDGSTGSLCIHSILLPDNQLMCIERPHTKPYEWINKNTNGVTATVIKMDTEKGQISFKPAPIKYNAFCAGHSQGADGIIHVIGGDHSASSTLMDASKNWPMQNKTDAGTFLFDGVSKIRTFDPKTNTWDESKDMTSGRWYPTVVTMGDGALFIASGSLTNLDFQKLANTNNPTYEFYPQRYQPAIRSQILDWAFPHSLYPVAFQLPQGKLFMMVSNRTMMIDPSKDPGPAGQENNYDEVASVPAMNHQPWIYPHTPTSFLLPLRESDNWKATVVICGGTLNTTKDASPDCISITPEVPNAKWVPLPNMPNGRLMPDATILPDGTILLTNGAGWGQAGGNAGDCEFASAPVFPTDLYDPSTNSWTTVGTSTIPRLYHSGALLLQDGSVITTGSEMQNYLDFWGTPEAKGVGIEMVDPKRGVKQNCYPTVTDEVPLGAGCTDPYEYRVELFKPAYLNGAARPAISAAGLEGSKWTYGSTVGVQLSASGAAAASISLMRYTTTTHSTNTDQRMIVPSLLFGNASYVVFKIPPNGNIAPPGNYHLFIMSKDGIPSAAVRVLLGDGAVTAVSIPTSGSTAPVVTAGGAGASGKSGAAAGSTLGMSLVALIGLGAMLII